MDAVWEKEFQERMRQFAGSGKEGLPISIKIRVTSGCFHEEHSPHAYKVIHKALAARSAHAEFQYLEHESGPEILAVVTAVTTGLLLAKSVIELITAIIKARSEGLKKGDKPTDPLELIVRRVDDGRKFQEEIVLRIGHSEPLTQDALERQLKQALARLVEKSGGDG